MDCVFATLNLPALPVSGSPLASKLFRIRTYEKRTRNSFRIGTSKMLELKVL
jgi:hypothetical protein